MHNVISHSLHPITRHIFTYRLMRSNLLMIMTIITIMTVNYYCLHYGHFLCTLPIWVCHLGVFFQTMCPRWQSPLKRSHVVCGSYCLCESSRVRLTRIGSHQIKVNKYLHASATILIVFRIFVCQEKRILNCVSSLSSEQITQKTHLRRILTLSFPPKLNNVDGCLSIRVLVLFRILLMPWD